MEVIRPALDDDVAILSRSFLNGYIPGSASFYVSVEHEEGYTIDVNDDIVNQWDEI
jgi:Cft2 family RNA processing exonuclease